MNDYVERACVDRAGNGDSRCLSALAEPKPSAYWGAEFGSGEMGAFLGGALGFLMGNLIGIVGIAGASSGCVEYGCLFVPVLGMNLGRALGASFGVVNAGSTRGVDGNIWGAYLATGLWYVVSPILAKTGSRQDGSVLLAYLSAPGIPAALATIGYNIGAKMKSDKSKPTALSWYLPLVALKF